MAHSPAHCVGTHVTRLALAVGLLVLLLHGVLVDVGVAGVHAAHLGEGVAEERGVLVAVGRVSIGGFDSGAVVDCDAAR